MECIEKTEFPDFGFSREGATGAWRSQETAPGENLHFGGSKVGGWVYHNWKLGAKMEILGRMPNFDQSIGDVGVAEISGNVGDDTMG